MGYAHQTHQILTQLDTFGMMFETLVYNTIIKNTKLREYILKGLCSLLQYSSRDLQKQCQGEVKPMVAQHLIETFRLFCFFLQLATSIYFAFIYFSNQALTIYNNNKKKAEACDMQCNQIVVYIDLKLTKAGTLENESNDAVYTGKK